MSPGDLVVTEKLRGVDVNQQIRISRVLMLGSRYESIIGRPLVPGAYVTAAIEVRQLRFSAMLFKSRGSLLLSESCISEHQRRSTR